MRCSFTAQLFFIGMVLAPALFGQTASYIIVEDEIQSPYMQGFPPSDDLLITPADHFAAGGVEVARWSYQNMSQIRAVDVVGRGGPVLELPYAEGNLLDETFTGPEGESAPLRQLLKTMKADGFIVLRDGVIQTEAYFNGLKPDTHHIAFSVTKSFVGALTLSLIEDGLIDPERTVADYMPELAGAAFGSATVRQVLDMTVSTEFDLARQRAINSQAGGFTPRPPGFPFANTLEWIAALSPQNEHGVTFVYNPANTETLSWIVTRVLGQHWQQALSERIWSKLGAEHDALVVVDPQGHGFATAGLNATLRDFARFGLMLARGGTISGQEVLAATSIDDIRFGDEAVRAAWARSSEVDEYTGVAFYRDQFRVLDADAGEFFALGASGQMIYVNQARDLVGVFLSTDADEMTVAQYQLLRQIGDWLAGVPTL